MKKYINYKQFDVVLFNQIHHSLLFRDLYDNKNPKIDFNKTSIGTYATKYLKTRPAIILKKLPLNNYLIIPITSKISSNDLIQKKYRTLFNAMTYTDNENIIHNSYLEWDQVCFANTKEFNGYYSKKNVINLFKPFNLPYSAKQFIKYNFNQRCIDFL